jgi:hypothetical protein
MTDSIIDSGASRGLPPLIGALERLGRSRPTDPRARSLFRMVREVRTLDGLPAPLPGNGRSPPGFREIEPRINANGRE